ncbi:HK97 gp10 family phage protein [Pseudomonas sp. DTU_2021_1001937_2_SI_NGA_ILE_001]|uniref:HK97 gp10 family phage protein n=1 Tax=Pseudomonas sp. DTU_2021_1001937_2_SI_NGA_ILE_001 TaxID=3077589 RepID=UPI0028FC2909|nr:HK97 gp10 family phage protein [Pseudomonas sp. DTU_2021_1001937_2_SI_NGA_ILE_001]WNW10126.1 HK97 gp10 family phage protein [Pseudomonas sp. DTU_2021_1001937_2_SI_NGA_ILE_001]
MTSRYGGLDGSFAESLRQFQGQTLADMDEVFRKVMIQIGTSVIMLSPVDTGRFRGNWQFTVDQPASASLDNYDQAGHDTVARLVADVQDLTYGQTAYLVNNLIYSIPLEYGHSQQAPTGMVRITKERFQEFVDQALREVSE